MRGGGGLARGRGVPALGDLTAHTHRGALVWRNGFSSRFATTGLDWVHDPTAASATITALTGINGFVTSPFENTIGATTAIAGYRRCSDSGTVTALKLK